VDVTSRHGGTGAGSGRNGNEPSSTMRMTIFSTTLVGETDARIIFSSIRWVAALSAGNLSFRRRRVDGDLF